MARYLKNIHRENQLLILRDKGEKKAKNFQFFMVHPVKSIIELLMLDLIKALTPQFYYEQVHYTVIFVPSYTVLEPSYEGIMELSMKI